MSTAAPPIPVDVPSGLIEAIRSFPSERIVEHCGKLCAVSPFAIYSDSPHCGSRIKLRLFSGGTEIEDVFDAVFEWMNQPGVDALIRQRRDAIAGDAD